METFLATLTPMLTLFFCIAVGFTATKTKLLTESASKTMARMETWIFCPALNLVTMMRFCTPETFAVHGTNIALGSIAVAVSISIAIPLSCIFVRKKGAERGIYAYALAFANSGYMGDSIILSIFNEEVLSYYKLFCLPLNLAIYTWGISVLTPPSEGGASPLKRLLNAPTVSMLLGIVLGLSGAAKYMPEFIMDSMDLLKSCMGPVAMLLAGATVAKFNISEMLRRKKVYIAALLRLVAIPAVTVATLLGIVKLLELALGLSIGYDPIFLCFFSASAAIGLNTIIFPEAFGGDPSTGAGMAMISHTLCIVTVPLMYAAMTAIFGLPFQSILMG